MVDAPRKALASSLAIAAMAAHMLFFDRAASTFTFVIPDGGGSHLRAADTAPFSGLSNVFCVYRSAQNQLIKLSVDKGL
jgi:hypothetical protein